MVKNDNIIPIADFLLPGSYTISMHEKIASCKCKDINRFMQYNGIYNNIKLCVNKYNGKKLIKNSVKNSNMSVIINNKKSTSYIYDAKSLNTLLRSDEDYIFKPIFCKLNSKMHLVIIILDIKKKSIYIFDSSVNLILINHIEYLIDQIISDQQFIENQQFHVIPVNIWNKNLRILNKISKKSLINYGGFCVMISLLISHYMKLTNINLNKCIKIFNKFSKQEILSIYNDYSIYYYFFLKN
jgi:hypothetical protein